MSYIKAKEVLSLFNDLVNECVDKDDFYNRAFDVVDAMPTADVVEVRHGHWIEHIEKPSWLEDDVEVYYNCSECGTSHWSIMPPYCPECGAKMDRRENHQ